MLDLATELSEQLLRIKIIPKISPFRVVTTRQQLGPGTGAFSRQRQQSSERVEGKRSNAA